jgi:hypothetical protein
MMAVTPAATAKPVASTTHHSGYIRRAEGEGQGEGDREDEEHGDGDGPQDNVLEDALPVLPHEEEDDARERQDEDEIDQSVREGVGVREGLDVGGQEGCRQEEGHQMGGGEEAR